MHHQITERSSSKNRRRSHGARRLYLENLESRHLLAADPIAWWAFDDAANVGRDSSTQGSNLLSFGDAAYHADGKSGGALSLDGNGDYLGGIMPVGLPTGVSPYTIAAWIRPDTTGMKAIAGWGNFPNVIAYNTLGLIGDNGVRNDWGSINLRATDAQVASAGVDLDDGNWHHVLVANDGSMRRLYVDGSLVASGNTPAAHLDSDANFRVGSACPSCGGEFFDGLLDDVVIWNEALNSSEIAQLVQGVSPLDLTEAGLVGHWVADDLVGTIADGGSVTSWNDSVSGLGAVASGTVTLETNELNGHAVMRFNPSNGNDQLRLSADNNPLSGAADFTVAVVFRANSAGVGQATSWFQNTGLVDAEQPGVTNDWGVSLTSDGRVGAGLGSPDVTQYSANGADLADGAAHLAIYRRTGNTVTLSIDDLSPSSRSDGSTTLRGTFDVVFGSLQTNQNFFDGDIAEIQFFNKAIDDSEAQTLVGELMTKYDITAPELPLQVAGDLLVDLRATHPSAGTTSWINTGTLGDFSRIGNPLVEQIAGVTAVTFNSDHPTGAWDDAYQGPQAPVALTGGEQRTIEVWAYNPNDGLQQPEETIVAWGRRGGPEGSNLTFGYGNHATWGAVGHWGAPDMPWFASGGSPALGQWHHLVYTYDGSAVRLYSDGALTYSEAVGTLQTHSGTTINLAVQNGTSGVPSFAEGQAGSFSVANVRIHSGVLSPEAIVTNYTLGIQLAGEQPVTSSDAYTTPEDMVLQVTAPGVLQNDSDPNALPLAAQLDTPASHGTVVLNADGSFTYTPDENYHGPDSFTYRAFNGEVPSDATTVQLTVSSVYDPAVAVADHYVVATRTLFQLPANLGVLSNDLNVDQLPLTAVLVSDNTAGTLSLQPNGALTYDPLAFKGPQTFTYRINDTVGNSNTVTVTLLVDTPPSADDDSYSVAEDGVMTVPAAAGVLLGDSDADGDPLTAHLVDDVEHGTLQLQPNGSFTYTPHENYFGPDSFTYRANDGDQDSPIATVHINVTAVNDAPVAADDRYFGFQNQQIIRSAVQGVLANDLDVDGPSLSVQLVTPPGTGTLNLQTNGSFTYTPTPGFLGTTRFTYRVSDSLLNSSVATVELVINSPDQQVVINEVNYDPDENTIRGEFIELFNAGQSPVDLSQWFFSDGIDYSIPAGTTLGAGQYLIVAEDPATIQSLYGVAALGPWDGQLTNDGETVTLRNALGRTVDTVSYGIGFPWPVAASGSGSSMELIHPSLDNDLGGSWRSSESASSLPDAPVTLLPAASSWRYRKGVSEPSSPVDAWRMSGFAEDASWLSGQTPLGYGDGDDNTTLSDMLGTQPNNYTTVYLRNQFQLSEIPELLKLRVYVDDGAIVWINGVEVARLFVSSGHKAYNAVTGLADHEASWTDLVLDNTNSFLVQGTNTIAIHALNVTPTSSDFSIDAEVIIPDKSESPNQPSPGRQNSVYSVNAPPQSRQVDHSPNQPTANEETVITLKVTDPDGVESVDLQYQVVLAGQYVPAFLPVPVNTLIQNAETPPQPNPAYYDLANWTTVSMVDDGTGADAVPGDGVYTVVLPGQPNRTLVRYRMIVEDSLGANVQVPYADDPSLNFAYFVYDGVPDYSTNSGTIGSDVLESLPVYHFITRSQDMQQVLAYTSDQIPQGNTGSPVEARFVYNWPGTFVYEGEVYDNIKYRLRGANGRYHGSGKRSMRFRFNDGHYFQALDQDGNPYPTTWRTLTTGKGFDNRMTLTYGLNEAITMHLYNQIGLPASETHWAHFRVIDDAQEAPDQWHGDFWGLNFIVETYDVRFLESHEMEKGNLYKLINSRTDALGQQRYQAKDAVSDGSDHDNIEINLTGDKSADYIDAHVNLEKYYLYHALAEAVRHYDYWPSANKNMVYYFEPTYLPENNDLGKLWILPWDTDASWGPTWNEGHDVVYNALFPSGAAGGDSFSTPELWPAYFNVVREIRDLLWQPDQLNPLIDEFAAVIADFQSADRARWQNAPATAGNYNGLGGAGITSLAALVQDMKNFAFVGGNWPGGGVGPGGRAAFLDQLQGAFGQAQELPDTPAISYTGEANFPSDGLAFQTSPFTDPQGNNTFAAMEWRLAEITDPNAPAYDPDDKVLLEWNATWESGELTTYQDSIDVPAGVAQPGHTYRARVRVKDATGHWSHWSPPLEFTATVPDNNALLSAHLRISEVAYDPLGPSAAEVIAGFDENDDFEFIELVNTSLTQTLDLIGANLSEGVSFAFADGAVTSLGPGERLVVVEDIDAFRFRHGDSILIAGEWSGALAGSGERLLLSDANNDPIIDFTYGVDGDWPTRANGNGSTLQVIDTEGNYNDGNNWRASTLIHGSPGGNDPAPITGVVINEVLANTDGSRVDAIELYNATSEDVDLSGWFLSDGNGSADALARFQIPDGTILRAGGYLVFDESHFNASMGVNPNDFALSAGGEEVWLSAGENGVPRYLVDGVEFAGSLPDVSHGRVPNGNGILTPLHRISLSCENGNPRVGPVVFSELMYSPAQPTAAELAADPTIEAAHFEFIELYNASTQDIDLSGWMIAGGVELTLPLGTHIAAGETVVLLGFGLNDTAKVELFEARYGVTVQGNPRYVGSVSGRLSDEGEAIQLLQMVDVAGEMLPIVIDEVQYDDQLDWPELGEVANSLVRDSATAFGSHASHWSARAASPGAVSLADGVVGDVTGDGLVDARDIDLVFDEARRNSNVSAYDLNQNGSVTTQDAIYLATEILGVLLGDANLDGVVDGQDFNLWNKHKFIDCGGSWTNGDFNGDAVVDGSDFNLWNSNRFQSASQQATDGAARMPRAPLPNRALPTVFVDQAFADRPATRPIHAAESHATNIASGGTDDDASRTGSADSQSARAERSPGRVVQSARPWRTGHALVARRLTDAQRSDRYSDLSSDDTEEFPGIDRLFANWR